MKGIIKVLAGIMMLCVITFTLSAPAYSKSKKVDGVAEMTAKEKVYDFGTIKEANGAVTHTFEVINTGDGNLVIYDATAECGCTRPEFSPKPVAPGKSTKIKVTFNPAGRAGSFEKTVTVKANSKPAKLRLKIRGSIIPKSSSEK